MSGTCSAHKHYERDCPRCQTEKPEWVQALEAKADRVEAAETALREIVSDTSQVGAASYDIADAYFTAHPEARELLAKIRGEK